MLKMPTEPARVNAPPDCRCHADADPARQPEPPRADTPTVPDTTPARAALLWAARVILGAGRTYPGPLRVVIRADGRGTDVTVRPTPDADGLASADVSPAAAAEAVARSALLARHFLGDDERRILVALADLQPTTAQAVCDRVKMTRSTFFALWGSLQGRGLVDELDSGRFEVPARWVGLVTGEGQP